MTRNCNHAINYCEFNCPYCAEYSNPDMCEMEKQLETITKQADLLYLKQAYTLYLIGQRIKNFEALSIELNTRHPFHPAGSLAASCAAAMRDLRADLEPLYKDEQKVPENYGS